MAGGRVEERVRAWVRRRTQERGARARLAEHLHRERAWVTKYINSQVDADLDTTLAIAQFFDVAPAALFGTAPLPAASATAIADREFQELWRKVPMRDRPILRGIIELYARGASRKQSTSAHGPERRATAHSSRRRLQGA